MVTTLALTIVPTIVIGKQRHIAKWELMTWDARWETTAHPMNKVVKKLLLVTTLAPTNFLIRAHPTKHHAPMVLTTMDVTWEAGALTISTVPEVMTPVQEFVLPLVIGKKRHFATWELMTMDAGWETTAHPVNKVVKKLLQSLLEMAKERVKAKEKVKERVKAKERVKEKAMEREKAKQMEEEEERVKEKANQMEEEKERVKIWEKERPLENNFKLFIKT